MVGQLTDPTYYILLLLVEAKQGYSIMKGLGDIKVDVGGASNALYSLKKLQETDLIHLYGEEEERRKTYIATELPCKKNICDKCNLHLMVAIESREYGNRRGELVLFIFSYYYAMRDDFPCLSDSNKSIAKHTNEISTMSNGLLSLAM